MGREQKLQEMRETLFELECAWEGYTPQQIEIVKVIDEMNREDLESLKDTCEAHISDARYKFILRKVIERLNYGTR